MLIYFHSGQRSCQVHSELYFFLIIRAQRRTSAFRAQKTRCWRFSRNGISSIFYYYFARKRRTFKIIGIHDQTRPLRRPTRSSSTSIHLSISPSPFCYCSYHISLTFTSPASIPSSSSAFGTPSTLWHPDPHRTIKTSQPRLNIPMLKVTKCPGIFTPNF